jgi:hypothetical protein
MAIRSREICIHVSRVGQQRFNDGKRVTDHRKVSTMRRTENNLKAIMNNLAMILLPKPKPLQESLSEAIGLAVLGNIRTVIPVRGHD